VSQRKVLIISGDGFNGIRIRHVGELLVKLRGANSVKVGNLFSN
jgi:hypothetical protein